MLRRTLATALASIAATLVATGPALAQRSLPRSDWDNGRGSEEEPPRGVSLSDVIRELQMLYGGRHLDAHKEDDRYVIAWITGDGKRLTIVVDARTGRIISVR